MNWHRVAPESEIESRGRKLLTVDTYRLALFRDGASWYAIDNHCPHRGGPIAAGEWNGACLTCPWHGAQFDLSSGQPLSGEPQPLQMLPVRIHEGFVEVDLDALSTSSASPDDIHRFVVRYGNGGDIGLFGTIHVVNCQRGDQVIAQTQRGVEVGVLLHEVSGSDAGRKQLTGELLRVATAEDLARWESSQAAAQLTAEQVTGRLERENLRVQIVEAEQMLESTTTVVYYLGESSTALGPLAVQLTRELGKDIRFQKLKLDDQSVS